MLRAAPQGSPSRAIVGFSKCTSPPRQIDRIPIPSICHTINTGSRKHRTVVIIAINHLHHQHRNIIAAITDRDLRQHQQIILLSY
jgi:hypothetical protein